MAQFVTDTHPLAWYLAGVPRLSGKVREIFDQAVAEEHEIIIPALVIAELVMVAEKQRVLLDMAEVIETLQAQPAFQIVALTPAIAIRCQSLSALPDIHDRLIVATAQELDLPILTRDEAITQSGLVSVIWDDKPDSAEEE